VTFKTDIFLPVKTEQLQMADCKRVYPLLNEGYLHSMYLYGNASVTLIY